MADGCEGLSRRQRPACAGPSGRVNTVRVCGLSGRRTAGQGGGLPDSCVRQPGVPPHRQAPLGLPNPGPLLPGPPRSSPLGPLLGLCPRSQPTAYTQTHIHTLPEASELTHNTNSGARAPFLAHICDPFSTLGLVLCFKGLCFHQTGVLPSPSLHGCVRKGALEAGPRSLAEARRRERASGRRGPGWQPSQIQGRGPGLHRGATPCKSELCGESLWAEGTQVLCHLDFH